MCKYVTYFNYIDYSRFSERKLNLSSKLNKFKIQDHNYFVPTGASIEPWQSRKYFKLNHSFQISI